jgi:hypothetical protein
MELETSVATPTPDATTNKADISESRAPIDKCELSLLNTELPP